MRARAGWSVALGLAVGLALAAEQRATRAAETSPPAPDGTWATLELGEEIKGAGLVGLHGESVPFQGDRARMIVPAGSYRIESVELANGWRSYPGGDDSGNVLTLQPGETRPLHVQLPLTSQVQVSRYGRSLTLDCKVMDAAGRAYRPMDSNRVAPSFTIYCGDEIVESGSFRYG